MSSHFRVCHLCEAMCGLRIDVDGDRITSIRGDREDPFSRGYLCSKAASLKDIDSDPERLRGPSQRIAGRWHPLSWEDALDKASGEIIRIRRAHGSDAVAIYLGNPVVHDYGAAFYAKFLATALQTRHRFSAASVDGLPHLLTSFLMFGNQMLMPVPDLDRTMFFLCLGANPAVSNGSVMAAPGMTQRLRALRERGGQCVVIDPRQTETADLASRHHFIRPGSDALLLLALLHVVFEERLSREHQQCPTLTGRDTVERLARGFAPEVVAERVGIAAVDIRRLARQFAAASTAVCYGRIGVSTQEYGALTCWLIQVLNIVTGNFDRPGGAMFSNPALDLPALARSTGDRGHFGEFHSSVRHLPEFGGELPVAALAEEIEAGQIRALITFAGNPVLSAPNGTRLERAIGRLDFMVAVDLYENETSRLANIILPPASPLQRDHYPLVSHLVAVRNTAKYSPAVFPRSPAAMHDWQILFELKRRIERGASPARRMVKRLENAALGWLEPSGILDLGLRLGPYGWRRSLRQGLTLGRLRNAAHGLDFGPLTPMLQQRLRGRPVDLAPQLLVDEVARMRSRLLEEGGAAGLHLIGRRQIGTNNSWMPRRGSDGARSRCTLLINPGDARDRDIGDGAVVSVRSASGDVLVVAEFSERMMRGVVSLPHGWGRAQAAGPAPGASQASFNDLTCDLRIDALAGTAAFNSTRVEVVPHRARHDAALAALTTRRGDP